MRYHRPWEGPCDQFKTLSFDEVAGRFGSKYGEPEETFDREDPSARQIADFESYSKVVRWENDATIAELVRSISTYTPTATGFGPMKNIFDSMHLHDGSALRALIGAEQSELLREKKA